jgi:hypothetical protein
MPLINADFFGEDLPKQYAADPFRFRHGLPGFAYFGNVAPEFEKFKLKPDRASALKVLDAIGQGIKGGYQMHKAGRPWDLCPTLFDGMDRAQPWWGWEFETGWKTNEDRLAAVGHVWDNFDGCMFDGEGEGQWQVEITFTPEEMSKYLDGTATTCKFMKWMSDNKHMVYNGAGNDVGTHLNISDPRFKGDNYLALCRFLNRTLHFTRKRNGDRKELFGRESVYAGFHANQSANGKSQWLEFKGFRTTYDYDTFQKYIKTATGLQKVVDAFFTNQKKIGNRDCVSNLYEVTFENAEPIIESLDNLKLPPKAAPMSTRFGGSAEAFGPL